MSASQDVFAASFAAHAASTSSSSRVTSILCAVHNVRIPKSLLWRKREVP
jgi:hypothetical protein